MGYIGNQPADKYTTFDKQTITGDGGTGYTLDHAVANAQEIEVFVNNVRQEPGVAYTVSGTTLTMTGNVASDDDFYVVYQGKAIQTVVPADDTITTAMLQDNSVTNDKVASTILTTTSSLSAANITGQRYFYAYKSGTTTQSVTPDTDTKVELDGAIQSGTSWSTTNDEFTATADDAGDWMFTGQVSFYADGNNMDNPRVFIFIDTGSGFTKGAGGYSWVFQGTDQVRHFVTQVQQVVSISSGDKVALYGALSGTTTSFFAGDSTAGYKQCSLIGVKLS